MIDDDALHGFSLTRATPSGHPIIPQGRSVQDRTSSARACDHPDIVDRPCLRETRYAKSGDVNIAYQVVGDGPLDLVFVPGFVSHLDLQWADPRIARFLDKLASFSRLILFDKRGTGLSDPSPRRRRWRSAWTTSAP